MISKMNLDRGGFMKQYRDMQRIGTLLILMLIIFVGTIFYFNSRISNLERKIAQLRISMDADSRVITEDLENTPKNTVAPTIAKRSYQKPAYTKAQPIKTPPALKTAQKDVAIEYNPAGNDTPEWLKEAKMQ
jgi:hypothetical protein